MLLSGQLSDWSVGDLLQMLHITKKSASLHVEGDERSGVVYFEDGAIIDANCTLGVDANTDGVERIVESVYVLQLVQSGTFAIESEVAPSPVEPMTVADVVGRAAAHADAERDLDESGLLDARALRLALAVDEPITFTPEVWAAISASIPSFTFSDLEARFGRSAAVSTIGQFRNLGILEAVLDGLERDDDERTEGASSEPFSREAISAPVTPFEGGSGAEFLVEDDAPGGEIVVEGDYEPGPIVPSGDNLEGSFVDEIVVMDTAEHYDDEGHGAAERGGHDVGDTGGFDGDIAVGDGGGAPGPADPAASEGEAEDERDDTGAFDGDIAVGDGGGAPGPDDPAASEGEAEDEGDDTADAPIAVEPERAGTSSLTQAIKAAAAAADPVTDDEAALLSEAAGGGSHPGGSLAVSVQEPPENHPEEPIRRTVRALVSAPETTLVTGVFEDLSARFRPKPPVE